SLPCGRGRPRASRGRVLRGRPDSSRSRSAICPSWQGKRDPHPALLASSAEALTSGFTLSHWVGEALSLTTGLTPSDRAIRVSQFQAHRHASTAGDIRPPRGTEF